MMAHDKAMLWLGAHVAEVEGLYACVLETRDEGTRQQLLAELSEAGARLARCAGQAAGAEPRRRAATRPATAMNRTQRRIARVQRTTARIIARCDSEPYQS